MDQTAETKQGFGPCPSQEEGVIHLATVGGEAKENHCAEKKWRESHIPKQTRSHSEEMELLSRRCCQQ